MKLNVLRADPAGNITLFVLDPIEREHRAALAAELMRRGVDYLTTDILETEE